MPLKPSPGSAVSLSVKSIFSRQSCDTVKYLFLLSVWAWFLTAGGELINNVIKTHSPRALSPSPSSGQRLQPVHPEPSGVPRTSAALDACVLLLSGIVGHGLRAFFAVLLTLCKGKHPPAICSSARANKTM